MQYTPYINVGTQGRGTVIIVKNCYQLTDVRRITNRKGISGVMNGITKIRLYATAGTEKRKKREQFCNKDINFFLQQPQEYMILAGDVNCY
jgi:hypothetical protein